MREWSLTYADPMAPRISADARAGHTNYHDDQTWQLYLGKPDEPALSLETQYGGRVGMARLVPTWTVGRRQIREAQGYHRPPVLTAFAPDYLRLSADLTLSLALTVEVWTMESQAIGGRFTLRNGGTQAEPLRFELNAQAVRENKTLQMFFLTLENGQVGLQLGRLNNLQPVLLLDGAADSGPSPRLTRTVTLNAGEQVVFRWVLAGAPDRDRSLQLAYRWLAVEDWEAPLTALHERAAAAPQVETGHPDWDLALAWSQQLILRSFFGATNNLPYPSFVGTRKSAQGYAVNGVHPSGFAASWGGQTAPEALYIAGTVALAAPDLAKGIVRNFLAVMHTDGTIDAKPGLDNQRAGVLAPPLLATLAYAVYRWTGDKNFLAESCDKLLAFFRRWLQPDLDRDRDGLPEWSRIEQGAFADSPTLAPNRRWSQGIEVSSVEAPDLAAYLVREAGTLIQIATLLQRPNDVNDLAPLHKALSEHLDAMWHAERGTFNYRDRDTHSTPAGEVIFEAKGDQPLRDKLALKEPARLILRVSGGMNYKPKVNCTIEGIGADGQPTNEQVPAEAFDWYRSLGSATSKTVWREINYLKFEGLSRVYTIQVSTVDLTRHDLSLLLPLWAGTLSQEQIERSVALLTDPARYWHEYGLSACPATDPAFDPTNQNGCGGVSPLWMERIAEALLDTGHVNEAVDLFRRLLAAQIRSLRDEHTFRAAYNPKTGEGLGDADVITGVVSWGWFGRLFGAHVLAPDQVMITGPFLFEGEAMTWTQHGVTIRRDAKGTAITFPSGHKTKLAPDAKPQIVHDPKAKKAAPPKPPAAPSPTPPAQKAEDVPE